MRDAARGARGLKLSMHDSTASTLEGVLARGDRRLADVIERAFLRGARFDSWDDRLKIEVWREAFESLRGGARRRSWARCRSTARLPWDHFDVGLEARISRARVPKGAEEPAQPAVRQSGRHVHPPHERRRRRGRPAQARLLRLRRRLRSVQDATTSEWSFCAGSAPSSATRAPTIRKGKQDLTRRLPEAEPRPSGFVRRARAARLCAFACASARPDRPRCSAISIWFASCRERSAAPACGSLTARVFIRSLSFRSGPRCRSVWRAWTNSSTRN